MWYIQFIVTISVISTLSHDDSIMCNIRDRWLSQHTNQMDTMHAMGTFVGLYKTSNILFVLTMLSQKQLL